MTHVIKFLFPITAEWFDNRGNKVPLTFAKNDIVSCYVNSLRGAYCKLPYYQITLSSGIDLWNVPEWMFQVLEGTSISSNKKAA